MACSAFGATPTVTLSKTIGPPTIGVLVSGSNLNPNDVADIYFDQTNVGSATTDSTGAFSNFRMQVPATAQPGVHSVTAVPRGIKGGDAGTSFTVSTDWAQLGFMPPGKRHNPFENSLNRSNVGSIGPLWSFNPGNSSFTLLYTPAVANGVAYVGSYDFSGGGKLLYALDASTGAQLWSFAPGDGMINSPTVINGVVYAVSIDGVAWALNASTGAVLWSQPYGGGPIGASPTVSNGVLYFATANGSSHNAVHALNVQTGLSVWASSWPIDVFSTAALVDGVMYFGDFGGSVSALNAHTGALLWNVHVSSPSAVTASPAVSQGVVYVGSQNNTVYALNSGTGAVLWTFATGGPVYDGAAVANGVVYVGSADKNLYALNASTGAKLWSFTADNQVDASPAVANGVVYIQSGNTTYALNATTGAQLWSYPIGSGQSSPVVVNGIVYASSDSTGTIYAFGLPK
jgi:outer membrane protein assembly factor BamB